MTCERGLASGKCVNTIHFVNGTRTKAWERRRAAKRERILDAARELVVEGGLDALTINGLARQLDYSPGALYRYFRSKEALIVALQVEAVETFRGLLQERLRSLSEAPPLARILAVVEVHRQLADVSPADYRLVSATIADPRQLVHDAEEQAASYAAFAGLIQQVSQTLLDAEQAEELGPSDDPAQRAVLLLASHQGLLQLGKVSRYAPDLLDPRRLGDALVDGLLTGWGADPSQIPFTRALLRAPQDDDA
ncbi:MAG TPA: hypothetical protein DEA08_08010 [Planctomycetes bacterium]|nr:hypothetical protein [Planctomycetota bacterium]